MRLSSRSQKNSQGGFNLVEIMVAILIFALTITALYYSQTQASRKYLLNKEETLASILASSVMSEIESQLEVRPFEDIDKSQDGEGKEAFAAYKWQWTLKKIVFELPPITSLLVPTSEEEVPEQDIAIGGMIIQAANGYLKETIRELTVAVSWTSSLNQSVKKYTLTTHLIDLSKPLQLTGQSATTP